MYMYKHELVELRSCLVFEDPYSWYKISATAIYDRVILESGMLSERVNYDVNSPDVVVNTSQK
jgi:hypothetical protein